LNGIGLAAKLQKSQAENDNFCEKFISFATIQIII
jgi:hypothetical protein